MVDSSTRDIQDRCSNSQIPAAHDDNMEDNGQVTGGRKEHSHTAHTDKERHISR